MRVLVLGGSGLVGRALLRALARSGMDAVGTARTRTGGGLLQLDVTNADAVAACVAQVAPEVVCWLVKSRGGMDEDERHPDAAHALHVQGAAHVARWAASSGARLIYLSTDAVFDGTRGPYGEEDPPAPKTAYGRMKWEAERVILESGCRHLILRTSLLFGWDRGSTNIAMEIWRTLQAGQAMPVAEDQWCTPTLAEYLAEIIARLIPMDVEGLVNVAGKDRLCRAELARRLARAMALDPALITPLPMSRLNQAAARPLSIGLRTEKLAQWLGTDAMEFSESLKRFQRHWRSETHTRHAAASAPPPAGSGERLRAEILDQVKRYAHLAHQPGPFVPYQTRIQYAGRVFGEEELVNLVDSALDFWLTLGPYGERFEHALARWFQAHDAVMTNSGSTANLAAVMALMSKSLERPLRRGDEVITPAVTFPTTLAPLVHGGLIPVFVDAEIGTYNINPGLVEAAVSEKTRALVIPHTLGNPCDLDILVDVAARHELWLIEDCCDAFGGTFRDRPVGTFGALATLSFFPAHQITTGEGGAVIVNRPRLSRLVRSVRDWGRDCWCAPGESNTCGTRFGWQLGGLPRGYDHKYIYSTLGYNFKPTDLQAAIGVAQLERLPEFIAARERHFVRLYEGLQPYQDALILPTRDPRSRPSWFGFPLSVNHGYSRDALVQWLESANIETRSVFGGNILRQPGYADIPCRIAGPLTQSDRIMRDTFFIGVYPGLTEEMLAFVLERFQAFFARRAPRHAIPVSA